MIFGEGGIYEEGKWRLMRKVEIWRKKVYIQEGEVEIYGGED